MYCMHSMHIGISMQGYFDLECLKSDLTPQGTFGQSVINHHGKSPWSIRPAFGPHEWMEPIQDIQVPHSHKPYSDTFQYECTVRVFHTRLFFNFINPYSVVANYKTTWDYRLGGTGLFLPFLFFLSLVFFGLFTVEWGFIESVLNNNQNSFGTFTFSLKQDEAACGTPAA